jgi:type I restriction enzyme R subunit
VLTNPFVEQSLRLGLGLTKQDLAALDRMLVEANLGTDENYQAARKEGLGLFIRSLVGLDRQAAMRAFDHFLRGRDLNANQQEFVAMIIEELTRSGIMDAGRLYESPYIDLAPKGLQSLFGSEPASELTRVLDEVKRAVMDNVEA